MDKNELARKITKLIENELPLYPLDGLCVDPITMNPVINIMESKDNHRKRFHIEIVDVLDLIEPDKSIREVITIGDMDEFGDITGKGPWFQKGEEFTFIKKIHQHHCDGECWDIICKRKSDNKLFKFDVWDAGYHNGYIFCDGGSGLEEVYEKVEKTITYE